MKNYFCFLVAIVFVLVGYGFSEARKYKAVCKIYENEDEISVLV